MIIQFCPQASNGFEIIVAFEKAFAEKIGAKHCVAVNSGYTALLLALKAIGIGPGDEVIVPDFTMIATAHAVRYCGAKPIFVDVELETGNISAKGVEKAINKNTKAVIPVHIYGHPVDMDSLHSVLRKRKIAVIEDAAEAHGAEYKGKKIGTLGDAACFSFYANKIVNTGEGGAVTTDSDEIAESVRRMRSYGFGRGYHHETIGWSFRMNPHGAMMGMSQIRDIEKTVERKREIARFYNKNLDDEIVKPTEKSYARCVYWMYGIRAGNDIEKNEIVERLKDQGIETRNFFYPMSMQPMYQQDQFFPIALALSSTGILLPSMPELTNEELRHICDTINGMFT